MSQHQFTTTRNERVEAAVAAVRKGRGVLVVDDEDRENEGDIIFSAADRVKTIRTAIADDAVPGDLNHPGHVFPLCARSGGVRERAGHTEASVDLMRLAGLPPYGVLCELTNPDGTMARLPEIMAFSQLHDMPVLQVRDLIEYMEH